jgi:hypothetical protein
LCSWEKLEVVIKISSLKLIVMKNISIFILFLIVSCNKIDVPQCSDEKVKEEVLIILKDKLKSEIINDYSSENFALANALPASGGSDDYLFTKQEFKKASDFANETLKKVKLDNIITTQKIDSINKCNCESHIDIKYLGKLNVKYSAQLTDEGEPYVRVVSIESE